MTPAELRLLLDSERELEAHAQQRARVLASLIAVPGPAKPSHRRWAEACSATRR